MMADALWILVAIMTMAFAALSVFAGAGYRVALVSCLTIGLTPVGFVASTGIPVSIPELLLATLFAAIVLRESKYFKNYRVPGIVVVFSCFFLLQLTFAFLKSDVGLFDIVRDLRPVVFIGLLLIVSSVMQQAALRYRVRESHVFIACTVFLLTDVFYYVATVQGLISAGGISGEFYLRTGLVRYSDLLSMSLFGVSNYLVFFNRENPRRSFYWLLICGGVVVLSLNRTYALGLLIALSWWIFIVLQKATKSKVASLLVSTAPVIVLFVLGLIFARANQDAGEFVSRVTELFSLPLLLGALEYRFVQPALEGGYELTVFSFLFGKGFGFSFYVPWFSYRGLDPWHFSVDSLFAFAYFKYGIIGLSVWLFAVSRLTWFRAFSIANLWIWLYLFVHSGVNVPAFLFFLVMLVLLRDGSWLQSECKAVRYAPDGKADDGTASLSGTEEVS